MATSVSLYSHCLTLLPLFHVAVVSLSLFLTVVIVIHRAPKYGLSGKKDASLMVRGLYISTVLLLVRGAYRSVP